MGKTHSRQSGEIVFLSHLGCFYLILVLRFPHLKLDSFHHYGTLRLIRVHCLALGGVDLTSPAGKMTMWVISAVAEFERDLLLERTHSGIARARASGKRFGRPSALNEEQQQRAVINRIQVRYKHN